MSQKKNDRPAQRTPSPLRRRASLTPTPPPRATPGVGHLLSQFVVTEAAAVAADSETSVRARAAALLWEAGRLQSTASRAAKAVAKQQQQQGQPRAKKKKAGGGGEVRPAGAAAAAAATVRKQLASGRYDEFLRQGGGGALEAGRRRRHRCRAAPLLLLLPPPLLLLCVLCRCGCVRAWVRVCLGTVSW
eukprot:SAG25_NODE_1478_length_2942_cov_11.625747_1_plen_188_part_10